MGYIWMVLLVTVGFGAIGFADDFLKVSKFDVKGVPGRVRLGIGFAIALLAALAALWFQPETADGRARASRSSRTCWSTSGSSTSPSPCW